METQTITPGVLLCPKLTRDHIWLTSYGKMKVKLAAQVSVFTQWVTVLYKVTIFVAAFYLHVGPQ